MSEFGIKFILVLLICGNSFASNAQLYNFEGWASSSIGGRDGRIIKVTNLNSSGEGSLSASFTAIGKRTVVFEVGGIIDLQGKSLSITNPYITIAGQTAPYPGITLINGTLSIRTHDVIVQHICVRPGAVGHETGWEPDGISIYVANNVIIDHCSASWAVDENCSASGPRFDGTTVDEWRANTSHDVTISNCIIAEGLRNATHAKGQHSMGSLIHDNITNVAILKNLYSSNNARNPLFKAGAMGVVANNFIYNPGSSAIRYGFVASEWEGYTQITGQMSIVGNVMKEGPDTRYHILMRATNSSCMIYMENNIAIDQVGNNIQQYYGDASNLSANLELWNDNIQLLPSSQIENYVLKNAGARPWEREDVDSRIINDAIKNTGKIIDFESEVGGYPEYESTSKIFDEDHWNLEYMMQIDERISIPFPTKIETNKTFQFTINIPEEMKGNIEFVDLLSDGELLKRVNAENLQFDVLYTTSGDKLVEVVYKTINGKYAISKVETIHVETGVSNTTPAKEITLLSVYPNPANQKVNVEITTDYQQNSSLQLLDVHGNLIHNETINTKQQPITIDLQTYVAGVYLIVLKNGPTRSIQKLIITH